MKQCLFVLLTASLLLAACTSKVNTIQSVDITEVPAEAQVTEAPATEAPTEPPATEPPTATEAPAATEDPTEEPVLGMPLVGNKMICQFKTDEIIIVDYPAAIKTEITMPSDVKGCAIPTVNFPNRGEQWGYINLSKIGNAEHPILFIHVNNTSVKPALNLRITAGGAYIVRKNWTLLEESGGLIDLINLATALDKGQVHTIEGAKSPIYTPDEYRVVPAE